MNRGSLTVIRTDLLGTMNVFMAIQPIADEIFEFDQQTGITIQRAVLLLPWLKSNNLRTV